MKTRKIYVKFNVKFIGVVPNWEQKLFYVF